MALLFKENDIRSLSLEKGLVSETKKDVIYLASRKKNFVKVDCPACASKKYIKVFNKSGFDFMECQRCGTVFMNPRATEEMLSDFYAHSFVYKYWNKYIFPASEKTRKEMIAKPRLKRILELVKKYGIKKDLLIEVGPGFGTFCEAAIKSGEFKRVLAVEPCTALAKTCRAKDIEVIEKAIEKVVKFDSSPSVMVSFEVIEHLFSPVGYLKSCYRLMSKRSIIVVTCPNWQGFEISTLGPKSDSVDLEHPNLFNPQALQLLFKRAGFEVLEIFTPGELDVDIVRNKVLQKKFDISGQPFIKNIIFDKKEKLGAAFQGFLKANQLSSHMWLVAIKK